MYNFLSMIFLSAVFQHQGDVFFWHPEFPGGEDESCGANATLCSACGGWRCRSVHVLQEREEQGLCNKGVLNRPQFWVCLGDFPQRGLLNIIKWDQNSSFELETILSRSQNFDRGR